MKISEIIIDPVQSTYERLLNPDAVAFVEYFYVDLGKRSNQFTIPHRMVMDTDSRYELLDELDHMVPVSHEISPQYNTMLRELQHYLDP